MGYEVIRVSGADEREVLAWGRLVDDHADPVWTVIVEGGLEASDAAVVFELTWLRLAQRWPTLYPGLTADQVTSGDVRDWLADTARTEAEALIAQAAHRRHLKPR